MRTLLLRLCVVLPFAAAWGFRTPLAAAEPTAKPNVLFIVADDLRDALGCYGDRAVQTPNLDRLAVRGVRFERAYVQYPVCNPSRSSFLTGLRPDQTGVLDNNTILRSKSADVVTLPQLLKANGWRSEAFGKIFHLGGGRDAELRSRWMDLPASWHAAEAFEATAVGRRRLEGRNLTGGKLAWCEWGAMDGGDDDQPDGRIAKAAIARMEALGDQPWFLAVGFMKPHDPFLAPKKYFDLYPLDSVALRRDPAGRTAAPPLAVGFGGLGQAFAKFSDDERREFLRSYYAGTSFMDAQVGRLLDALDRLKLGDKTIVVFIGDHGYHLGERDWWNKATLFERCCRTPLIVAAPGVKPGVARGLVEFVDLFPTLADLCGAAPPAGLAGGSLRPLLEDPTRPGKEAAFTVVTHGAKQRGESVRTDRWRYTQWSDGATELYDHENDPEEGRNVVAAHPEVQKRLQALLKSAAATPPAK